MTPSRFLRLDAAAREFGFRTTRSFRAWCERRAVPYRRDGKVAFVDVADVHRAIEGLPVAGRPAADNDTAAWIRAARTGASRG